MADNHNGAHTHLQTRDNFGRAFSVGVALNFAFVVIEAAFGVFGNSVALLSDAGHNFGDVIGLLAAWVASVLVTRAPTARFTYGLRGTTILAALFNGLLLLVAIGAITWEALQRLGHPEPVASVTMMIVAAIGVLVNGVTALLFASGGKNDLNLRGTFLHMAADALVSVGVVVAGLMLLLTGWLWLDPVVSLAINIVVLLSTWSLLRDSLRLSLAAVPEGIDADKVRKFLESQPGVESVHDLHVWAIGTTDTALTAHLVMPEPPREDAFLHEIALRLEHDFEIGHPTLQIEKGPAEACALAPDLVV